MKTQNLRREQGTAKIVISSTLQNTASDATTGNSYRAQKISSIVAISTILKCSTNASIVRSAMDVIIRQTPKIAVIVTS